MRALYAVGFSIGFFLAQDAPAMAQSCPRCDQVLELQDWQWSCLLRRREELSTNAVAIFTLTERVCLAQVSPIRGGQTMIPSASENAPPVYILTREQLDCVGRRSGSVNRNGAVYRFDFATQCSN
jgi:hypothetical protein